MKKMITVMIMLFTSMISYSVNIIVNGDFESGTAINLTGTPTAFTNNVPNWTPGCTTFNAGAYGGSPDIFYMSSPNCNFGVPANNHANNRQVRVAGTRRYV